METKEPSKYYIFPIKKRRRAEKQKYSATTQAINFCASSDNKLDYRVFYSAAEWAQQKAKIRELMHNIDYSTPERMILEHLDREKPVCNLKKLVAETFGYQMVTYQEPSKPLSEEVCNCSGHDLLFFGHKCRRVL